MGRYGWIAAALLAGACGSGGRSGGAGDVSSGGAPSPGNADGAQGAACDGRVTVRLRGTGGAAIGTFAADVGAIDARVDGAALTPVWSASGTLELAGSGGAKLAVLDLTGCPGVVDLTLRLTRVHVCLDSGCVDPDLCTEPIHVRLDPHKVNPSTCEVAVRLDLARSLQPLPGGGETFLPRFSFRYE